MTRYHVVATDSLSAELWSNEGEHPLASGMAHKVAHEIADKLNGIAAVVQTLQVTESNIHSLICAYHDRYPRDAFQGTLYLLRGELAKAVWLVEDKELMSISDWDALTERLRSWAQNEEMIDDHYTEHGSDCERVARMIALLFHRRVHDDSSDSH
jgi:hypothetical protein